jgi:hypothetical protein
MQRDGRDHFLTILDSGLMLFGEMLPYAIHRLVIWEVPMMPPRPIWLRAALLVALPLIAAAIAMARP